MHHLHTGVADASVKLFTAQRGQPAAKLPAFAAEQSYGFSRGESSLHCTDPHGQKGGSSSHESPLCAGIQMHNSAGQQSVIIELRKKGDPEPSPRSTPLSVGEASRASGGESSQRQHGSVAEGKAGRDGWCVPRRGRAYL